MRRQARRAMPLVLERRAERSALIAITAPPLPIALTLVTMAILFALLGKNPITALGVYFLDPLTDAYTLQEIAVKATPLVMIGVGLSLCYIANVWNIGAEGQFTIGADLFMDYLVRGPWRDPHGLNFPTTADFDAVATIPTLIPGSRLHAGAIVA